MGHLHDVLMAHLAAQPYPVSQRRLAQRLRVAPSTLENWRTPRELIAKEHLVAIARVCEVPYAEVLAALLHDVGYLHEEQVPVAAPRGRRRDLETAAVEALRAARAAASPEEGGDDKAAWHHRGEDSA